MNYYLLSLKNYRIVTSAFLKDESVDLDAIENQFINKQYKVLDLTFKKLEIQDDGIVVSDNIDGVSPVWYDYQYNSLALPLFSKKLHDIIIGNLGPKDTVSWLEAVISNNGEKGIYYIPVFTTAIDILDKENTIFATGTDHIVIPCFSLKKAEGYNIFPRPGPNEACRITPAIYVSEKLRKAITKAKISEVEFEKVKTK